jgi:hypothetical protein
LEVVAPDDPLVADASKVLDLVPMICSELVEALMENAGRELTHLGC